MNELITIPHLGRKDVAIRDTKAMPLGLGDEKKQIIHGVVTSGDKSRPVSLVERFPQDLDEWIENWQLLHDAGLPVPPTVRRTDRGSLVVTNLKVDGSEMFGKGASIEIQKSSLRKSRQLKPSEVTFLRVYKEERTAIIAEVKRLTDIANQHKIVLPPDDAFEFLQSTDGTWRLVIVDLALVRKVGSVKEAVAENSVSTRFFIQDLEDCHNYLKILAEPKQTAFDRLKHQINSGFVPPTSGN